MLKVLIALMLVLCGWDWWMSMHRMLKYGIDVEFNKVIRWLAARTTVEVGSFLGIFLPAALLCAAALKFNLPGILWFVTGMRFKLAMTQVQSLALEKQLDVLSQRVSEMEPDNNESTLHSRPSGPQAPPSSKDVKC